MTECPAVPAAAETVQTVLVGSDAAFAAAAESLRSSGGRIVVRPFLYRQLVIGPRSGRELRIVGSRGTCVERILFWRTARVSLGHLTIGPIGGDARVELQEARDIDLHDLVIRQLRDAEPGRARRGEGGQPLSRPQ
jgi:hypothetical protein